MLLLMKTYYGVLSANPPPRTLTPEYKRAMEEYVRRHNINPISRHGKEESVDTVRID